jgi:hypothetical protein
MFLIFDNIKPLMGFLPRIFGIVGTIINYAYMTVLTDV